MVDSLTEYLSNRPNLERYSRYMDSSMADKISAVAPYIEEGDTVVSVGAGTGNLEKAIIASTPGINMVSIDASLPMLEEIQGVDEEGVDAHIATNPVLAQAEDLPVGKESADVIIASSLVHEIASYVDDFKFGKSVNQFYRNVAKSLKHGGRFILRDFVQPDNPDEEIILNVGNKIAETDADPAEFIEKFANAFKGDDLEYLKQEIEEMKKEERWGNGAKLKVKASHAFEIAAHYSWSQSFNEEVKEKYAYLPMDKYIEFIQKAFQEESEEAEVVEQRSYLQDGYRDHIQGRIDFANLDGIDKPLPDFTGVIVIEKK
jgi:ubiquinone/menaquinone biosynthesis C-methylase UbiE